MGVLVLELARNQNVYGGMRIACKYVLVRGSASSLGRAVLKGYIGRCIPLKEQVFMGVVRSAPFHLEDG